MIEAIWKTQKESLRSWFWHMSANKSESKSKDGKLDEDVFDFGVHQPITKEIVSSQGAPKEIHWNGEGKNKLRQAY